MNAAEKIKKKKTQRRQVRRTATDRPHKRAYDKKKKKKFRYRNGDANYYCNGDDKLLRGGDLPLRLTTRIVAIKQLRFFCLTRASFGALVYACYNAQKHKKKT